MKQVLNRAFRINQNLRTFTLGPNVFADTNLGELVFPLQLNTANSWTFIKCGRFKRINLTYAQLIE
jgi:hypothetical protein